MQGVSDEEIDAALDLEKATVDPRFAAPKGMEIPLRADPVAAQAAASDAAEAGTEAEIKAASEAGSSRIRIGGDAPPPSQPRTRIADSVLQNAEREAQAEIEAQAEAEAEAEIENTEGSPPPRGRRR
jgi:hypothetical protein